MWAEFDGGVRQGIFKFFFHICFIFILDGSEAKPPAAENRQRQETRTRTNEWEMGEAEQLDQQV